MRLMRKFLNKGHHLFVAMFYNSVGLPKILLENKTHATTGCHPVMTTIKNKRGIDVQNQNK